MSGLLRKNLILAAALAAACCAMPAQAAPILITSSGALGTNDTLDWGTVGANFFSPPDPFPATSALGLGVTGTSSGGLFQIRQQGPTLMGNFLPGTFLLWDQGAGPEMTLTFAQPVFGAGAQIFASAPGAFTARIALNGGALGTFTEPGFSNAAADGSAIFIGALDSTASISSITFDIPSASFSAFNFLIGTVSLNDQLSTSTKVPEPLTLSLFVAGFAGVVGMRRRARKPARQ